MLKRFQAVSFTVTSVMKDSGCLAEIVAFICTGIPSRRKFISVWFGCEGVREWKDCEGIGRPEFEFQVHSFIFTRPGHSLKSPCRKRKPISPVALVLHIAAI